MSDTIESTRKKQQPGFIPLLHSISSTKNVRPSKEQRDRTVDPAAEWLEADGMGGFASGTVGGTRTRRYHALLLSALRPPVGRFVLVNGLDAHIATPSGEFPISSQYYAPDVLAPDSSPYLAAFSPLPWPTWRYRLGDDVEIVEELFVPKGRALTTLRFSLVGTHENIELKLRPFLSGRDYHSMHHENPDAKLEASRRGEWVSFSPYRGVPEIRLLSNGSFREEPCWYRNFLYTAERDRGLDCLEDLAAPGLLTFDLSKGPAVVLLASELSRLEGLSSGAVAAYEELAHEEQERRSSFPSELHRSADAFLVRRGKGNTIIAGYPWFTDWGRDTFISLRGLCLSTGRLDIARKILSEWAGEVEEGMMPNFFPDGSLEPEYNTVDASLWYVVAAYELIERAKRDGRPLDEKTEERLWLAIEQVLAGYSEGARYHISVDPVDGLLAAGEPGVQLTWMDAKVGDHVITPRIGKPVEIQALWLNALSIGALRSQRWQRQLDKSLHSFRERFWNGDRGCLYDVVDVDHKRGAVDAALRPNQLLAVGGLPFSFLETERARSVVDLAEEKLLTPHGIRTLAPEEAGYIPHYRGGRESRDGAYHQGTAWGWLLGPFVEAWVRVRGGTETAKAEAYNHFLAPLERELFTQAGIGHISEIADAEAPFTPRGCPFQAWSLGELIRLKLDVLGNPE